MEDLIPSNLAKKSFANTSNSFYVVKGLKNTQEQYEMLCNRIKILRINDEKNLKKIQNNQNQIQKIQRIRNETNLSNHNYNELKRARNENLQLLKRKNKDLKDSIVIQFSKEYKIMSTSPDKRMITIEKCKFLNSRAWISIKQSTELWLRANKNQKKRKNLSQFKRKSQSMNSKSNKTRDLEYKRFKNEVRYKTYKEYNQSHVAYKNVRNKLDEMMGKLHKQRNTNIKKDVQTQNSNGKSLSFYVCNKKNN